MNDQERLEECKECHGIGYDHSLGKHPDFMTPCLECGGIGWKELEETE